jgi:2Fe-2S ferredoxin
MDSNFKIKFLPQNVEINVDPEKSLLKLAQENGIKIKSICNGTPSCAECRVKIVEGDQNVPAPSKAELNLIGTSYFLDGRRLSCQVRCFGPVTIDLTEQVNKVDTQKKVKGVKFKDQKDIHAKQDTLILVDDPKAKALSNELTSDTAQAENDNNKQNNKQFQGQKHTHLQQKNTNSNNNQKQKNKSKSKFNPNPNPNNKK